MLLVGGTSAAGAEPDWKARLTRQAPGSFPLPASCDLTYHLSWSNILKAGEAHIRFSSQGQDGRNPEEIYARATMRSSGLARALWPYDATAETWVDRDTLQSIRVVQEEEDRQERNIYRTSFGAYALVNEWTTVQKRPGSKPELRNRSYEQTEPRIRDLMSALLFLRSLSVSDLQQPVSLVCYPFRDPYLINIKLIGRESHEMLGRQVPSMKFQVTLSKVQNDGSLKVYDEKMKAAYVWLTDDARRLPLELKAEIFIGSIEVALKEYRESETPGLSPASAAPLKALAGVKGRAVRKRSRS